MNREEATKIFGEINSKFENKRYELKDVINDLIQYDNEVYYEIYFKGAYAGLFVMQELLEQNIYWLNAIVDEISVEEESEFTTDKETICVYLRPSILESQLTDYDKAVLDDGIGKIISQNISNMFKNNCFSYDICKCNPINDKNDIQLYAHEILSYIKKYLSIDEYNNIHTILNKLCMINSEIDDEIVILPSSLLSMVNEHESIFIFSNDGKFSDKFNNHIISGISIEHLRPNVLKLINMAEEAIK